MENLFFNLIRVSLGIQNKINYELTNDEWCALYELSNNQTISGICSFGVQKIFKDDKSATTIPKSLFLKWIGIENNIKEENLRINKRCSKLINYFNEQGFNCSILKGQGIAALYKSGGIDLSLLRQSGDIDIWIGGGRIKVLKELNTLFKELDSDYKHAHAPFYTDTEVEVHWMPDFLMNLFLNRKLQRYWKEHEDEICSDIVELPDGAGCINVPSIGMNRFYILLHCYRHIFFEGLGLRQVMDYYFVLRQGFDEYSRAETMKLVKEFGMAKFAAAMMWIMQEVFHLEEDCLLCSANEKEGRFLLNDIMQSGNFGHHDKRVKTIGNSKRVRSLSRILQRMPHLIIHYPKEVLWAPIWLAYHFVWKRTVGRKN